MLINRNDRASFYHALVGAIGTRGFILVPQGYYVSMEHLGTRGLACSLDGLEVLLDVSQGLFWVFVIPLGPVLPVEVVVVLSLSGTLKV